MHYLFEDVLAQLKGLPDFASCSDPVPKCPKSADTRCTSGYKTCQDGKSRTCVQYFDFSVSLRLFSIEIRFYDAPETHRGLVLDKSVALRLLFDRGFVNESALTKVM